MSQYSKKQMILNKVLEEISFKEYNDKLLTFIVEELKMEEYLDKLLFPNGIRDFNLFVLEKINQEFVQEAQNYDFAQKKTDEKISLLLQLKIKILKKYEPLVKEILANVFEHPFETSKYLWNSVNQIWIIIGDKSIDFNYYTKRISLGFIYVQILFYFIQDHSENKIQTQEYIIREINRMISFFKFKRKLQISELPILRYFFNIKL